MQPTGPSKAVKRLVCRNCGWKTEISDGEDRENVDRAAIDHHATTGHSIEASNASRQIDVGTGRRKTVPATVHGRGDD